MGRCSRGLVEITRGLLSCWDERKNNCERRQPKTISSVLVFIVCVPPKEPYRNTKISTDAWVLPDGSSRDTMHKR